jgi:hypothetical protein
MIQTMKIMMITMMGMMTKVITIWKRMQRKMIMYTHKTSNMHLECFEYASSISCKHASSFIFFKHVKYASSGLIAFGQP